MRLRHSPESFAVVLLAAVVASGCASEEGKASATNPIGEPTASNSTASTGGTNSDDLPGPNTPPPSTPSTGPGGGVAGSNASGGSGSTSDGGATGEGTGGTSPVPSQGPMPEPTNSGEGGAPPAPTDSTTAGAGGTSAMVGAGGETPGPAPVGGNSGVEPDGGAPVESSYESPCEPEQTEMTKRVVRDGITAVFINGMGDVIDDYWADPYIQHNPAATSGVATFKSFFQNVGPGFYSLSRLIGECDKVLIHGSYGSGATFDMLRVDPDIERMVEHWDAAAGGGQSNQSGHTTLDGETEVTDAELTGPNHDLVIGFLNEVMIGGDTDMAGAFLAADLIEHAADGEDGAEAFIQRKMSGNVAYSTIHHKIADGNFVFTLSEGEADGASYGFHDLFRVEGGVIVEHWDARLGVQAGASGEGIF